MPLDERDLTALWDMLNAARAVARFVRGLDYETYLNNEEKRAAVQYEILTIGEAANRVSEETQVATPHIPWRAIIAQRNVVAHLYDAIDDDKIWVVATERVPELVVAIEKILADAPKPDM